jgi:hypothetical protein
MDALSALSQLSRDSSGQKIARDGSSGQSENGPFFAAKVTCPKELSDCQINPFKWCSTDHVSLFHWPFFPMIKRVETITL